MKIPELSLMEDILISFLGEPKMRLYDELEGQRIFCCPRCAEENGGVPDGKFNLEVCFSKRLNQGGVFQCWRCSASDDSMKGSVLKLVKRYGGSERYKRFKELVKSIYSNRLYDLSSFSGITEENIIVKPELKLPKTYKPINLNGWCKQSVRDYLEKRKIDQKIIDKFHIGYTEWEEDEKDWSYRIIIPSYDNFGELNFYVGRDYTGNDKRPKYKNVKADRTNIIFQESLIDFDSDIILVEGAIDCIYGPNTIGLLGKTLRKDDYLYQQLRERANGKIIICLDADTKINEVKRIYTLLDFGKLKNKIWYIRLDGYKDFGEIYENLGKRGIIEAVQNARQFKEIDLIFE